MDAWQRPIVWADRQRWRAAKDGIHTKLALKRAEQAGNRQASWCTGPALAGPAGCLGDIGSHAAHFAEFVTGISPSEISAELTSFVPGRRVDDHVQIQLRYAGSSRAIA